MASRINEQFKLAKAILTKAIIIDMLKMGTIKEHFKLDIPLKDGLKDALSNVGNAIGSFGSMAAFASGGAGTAISVFESSITLAGDKIKSLEVPDYEEYQAKTEEYLAEVFDTTDTC
jgi:hypothetical protein